MQKVIYYLYISVSRDEIRLPRYEVWLVNGEVISNVFGDREDLH